MMKTALPVVVPGPGNSDLGSFSAALAGKVAGEVRLDKLTRALYSTDASVYQIVPRGVVIPRNADDVIATVKACARHGVPLTARGGGTSQAGQSIGPGVILDCSKYFNRILEINQAERWVRVEPGCVLDELNLELKSLGLQLPLDISTSDRATLGGMIANNSSGTHSVIYGKTVDYVLEIKAVLADGSVAHFRPVDETELAAKCQQRDREGECYRTALRLARQHAEEIDRRFPKILRRVGGYNLDLVAVQADDTRDTPTPFNLAPLLVGSEGTLAVTLEAKLRLGELPKAKALLVVQFDQLLDALAVTPAILAHRPAAVEVVDKYVLDSTRLNAEASRLRDFLTGDPGAILIVEFYADSAAEMPTHLYALEADLRQRGQGCYFHRATDLVAQARIWKLRRLSLGLSMAEKGDAKAISFVEDTAVAPERLRDYIAEFLDIIARHGTTAGVYAHASVGCLHVRPIVNLKTEDGVRKFEAIASEVADLVLKYGGTLSGEHGDGLVRSPFMERMYGPKLYGAFRELKQAFDPQGILNPGKIVDAPPLATNLRYGPKYVTPNVPTTFDFTADGGIARAAELCAGVGECRKRRGGTMCPSYQATREELHSTRGRANTLRLALTGQLELQGLTDPAVKEALDLCLECKACKSECPTNVDMARLKAEFLHQYFQKHGVPWRNWIFGEVAWLTQKGGRLGNWLVRSRLGRWLNDKLFSIDRRRIAPKLATVPFLHQLGGLMARWQQTIGGPRPGALLFPDTFANHFEPQLGNALCELVFAAGRGIIPGMTQEPPTSQQSFLPHGLRCCGRPMISNGLLDRAVVNARTNVKALHEIAQRGSPIIACEPSCILTIKDDYPALLRGEERQMAETVAARCFTAEEYLDTSLAAAPPGSVSFRSGPKKILVQAHCHQRALVGIEPTLRLLRRIPGTEVIDLDAGCCGMAGSFGYEKEHYEISRLVGEQRLFPTIRQAPSNAVIVAPGFSCRMQIEHFTGRKVVHPVELLSSLLQQA